MSKVGLALIIMLVFLGYGVFGFDKISKTLTLLPKMEKAEAAGWYNTDWSYRKEIIIDYNKVPNTDQSYFPVLVNRTDADWKDTAHSGHVGQADGGDFVFTSSGGTVKLDHEIEKYDPVTGELVAWIEVPSVSHTANTELYLYYGNAAATNQQNATNVWSNGYLGVWHMHNASNPATDSLGINNGAQSGGVTFGATGKVGKATSYDGVDDAITLAGPVLTTSATIEGWFFWDTSDADVASLFRDNTGTGGWLLGYKNGAKFTYRLGNTSFDTTVNPTPYLDKWTHFVMTKSGGDVNFALDGQILHTGSGAANTASIMPWHIMQNGSLVTTCVKGLADEIRISSVARAADWIITEYNNQSSPSTFYSVVGEENKPVSILLTTDGSVSFGTRALEAVVDTSPAGINHPETVQVDAGPADLDVKSSNFIQGGNSWSLNSSNGHDQVKWEFSKDGTNWSIFLLADTLYTFDTNVPQMDTRNIYLKLTMPTLSSSISQYSSTVTIVASAP